MSKEKPSSPIGVGVLTILTVLLVLTLAVFSALAYSSAKADMALSKINAQTVTDYYAADAQAVQLVAAFQAGPDRTLEATIPLNDAQSLYINLEKNQDGTMLVRTWKTVPADAGDGDIDLALDPLPVWDGTLPTD